MSLAQRTSFRRNMDRFGRWMTLVKDGKRYRVRGYSRRARDDELTGSAQQFDSLIVLDADDLYELGKLGDESARIQRPDQIEYDGRTQTVDRAMPIITGDMHLGWRCGVKG